MTYIECVNAVLRRMREQTVSTVEENTYSTLIGALVNDAKRQVEDSHQWSALRQSIVIPTIVDQRTYALTNCFQESVIVKKVIDDTNNHFLNQATMDYLNQAIYIGTATTGQPTYYIFNGTDATGQLQVDLYPTPSGIFQIRYDVVNPTSELTLDTTILKIPGNAVRDLALAYATRERGESSGLSTAEMFQVATQTLADAIAIDSNRYGKENIFEAI